MWIIGADYPPSFQQIAFVDTETYECGSLRSAGTGVCISVFDRAEAFIDIPISSKEAVLLEGDAEKKTERIITPQIGHISLLNGAHHGSATSSTPELLARAQPEFAIISMGKFNRNGHRRAEVLEGLRSRRKAHLSLPTSRARQLFPNREGVDEIQWGREQATMAFPDRRIPHPQPGHCAALR